MRVFVTGIAGFIGSHLAEELLRRGNEVTGVDTLLTGAPSNVPEGASWEVLDVAEGSTWVEAATADLIVHCAASYDDPLRWHRDVRTNVMGTVNAVIAARANGARLFYFQTALPPVTSYAASKIAGERYIANGGVDHVVFRLANVYGPRNLSGPVPAFYRRMTSGKRCTVVDTRRDMVYVDDLVEGVVAALEEPSASGVYDMCSGETYRILELHEQVAEALDAPRDHDFVPPAPDDVPKMSLDGSRALVELGWRPTTTLAEGVRRAVAWYEEHGVTRTYTHLRMEETA